VGLGGLSKQLDPVEQSGEPIPAVENYAMRLILLFVLLPMIELMLLLKLADLISGMWTFALVVVTGIVGASLARRQGWGVLNRLQGELKQGQLPTTTLVDALMIFVAGALLITPGILTDLFGFSLLVPFIRRFYRRWLMEWFRTHSTITTYSSASFRRGEHPPFRNSTLDDDNVIDSYVVKGERSEDAERP
jgi:UPF0716 protein FxsA